MPLGKFCPLEGHGVRDLGGRNLSQNFVILPTSVVRILIIDDASETSDSVSNFEFRY